MSNYYFGASLSFIVLLIIIFLIIGGISFYCRSIQKKSFWTFPAFLSSALVLALIFVFFDLKSPIDKGKSKELQNALESSYQMRDNGMEFRKAMGDLAKENGVLVDSNTSYLGKDIYVTYIKKSDWNKLAKIYNNLD